MNFVKGLERELNKSITENEMVGFKTTGSKLVDLNFSAGSFRNKSEEEICHIFYEAYREDRELALKWLFFNRDIRDGMGERRSFRVILNSLTQTHPEDIRKLIKFIPIFGRWDDLFALFDTPLEDDLINLIDKTLIDDINKLNDGRSISLISKWLPSINTSSLQTRNLAKKLVKKLGISEKTYRKTLAGLRKHLNIVETLMCRNDWDKIDYSKVPSLANIRYKNAFYEHDSERRTEFLNKLVKGKTKINASTAYPHDIIHKYSNDTGMYNFWHQSDLETLNKLYDITLEEMWKSLSDYVDFNTNTIVVADGSGSMTIGVGGGSNVTALEVANSLAIYFAEKLKGDFNNKYITFSETPRLVDLSSAKSLIEKIYIALKHNEIANTNIEAVLKLILDVAINNELSQEDLPNNIIIISDMEFDCCAKKADKSVFEHMQKEYENCGYKFPRLVFWNVCSRTNTVPLTENENGVTLVSGFSPSIADMVLSGELDPYKCLISKLLSERYDCIRLL